MSDANDTPAWRPDPTGRHAQRWFDGSTWTDHVADAHGTTATDPYQGAEAGGAASGAATAGNGGTSGAESGGPESTVAADDATTVSPGATAQADPTTAYEPAPEPSTGAGADAGSAAGWGAPQAPQQQQPAGWDQPAAAPEQPATGWGAPQAPQQQQPAGWGQPQPPQQPQQPQAAGWGTPQPQPAPGPYGAPGAAPYGTPAGYAPASTGGGFNPVGIIVVAVGAILAIVGAFALKWLGASGGSVKLIDFTKSSGRAPRLSDYKDITFMTKAWPQWGVYVALVVAILTAVGGAFVKALKPIAIIVGIAAAAWALFFAFDMVHWFKKDTGVSVSVQIGAYLTAAGFVIAGIGSLLPSKKA